MRSFGTMISIIMASAAQCNAWEVRAGVGPEYLIPAQAESQLSAPDTARYIVDKLVTYYCRECDGKNIFNVRAQFQYPVLTLSWSSSSMLFPELGTNGSALAIDLSVARRVFFYVEAGRSLTVDCGNSKCVTLYRTSSGWIPSSYTGTSGQFYLDDSTEARRLNKAFEHLISLIPRRQSNDPFD